MNFPEPPEFHSADEVKAFYQKMLDLVPDLIFKMAWREDTGYKLVFCSDNIRSLYGITKEEFLNDREIFYRDLLLPEEHEEFTRKLDKCRIELTRWDHEYRVKTRNKGIRWLHVSGNPEQEADGSVSIYGRAWDITDEKLHAIKMKHDRDRIEFALDAASEGVWDWDILNNKARFSVQSMRIIGIDEEMYGDPKKWTERIHPDDAKPRETEKKKSFEKNIRPFESIYRILNEDGKYRWILSRGKAVEFDENGKATRAVGVHKDITDIKVKEIELDNTISIISSQNNRLSNFAHIVSHNLRSHASNLKMLIDLFKTASEKEREEMLGHLEGISDGLSITISHLKELVEIQFEVKIVKEKLNLRSYLKNILNILNNEITKHGVTIEINIPLDVTVDYNPAYLESILLNFTTNAIKYSSPDRKPMLSFDFSIVDGVKMLSVADNGLGIDLKKHKNSLFGMYKTFHKHQNSRGIGLFITKNQVEAMGGKIEVISEVNKGTTFKIYFNEED